MSLAAVKSMYSCRVPVVALPLLRPGGDDLECQLVRSVIDRFVFGCLRFQPVQQRLHVVLAEHSHVDFAGKAVVGKNAVLRQEIVTRNRH
jgi:hypothetical protein